MAKYTPPKPPTYPKWQPSLHGGYAKRPCTAFIRCTTEEHATLVNVAKTHHTTISGVIRTALQMFFLQAAPTPEKKEKKKCPKKHLGPQ